MQLAKADLATLKRAGAFANLQRMLSDPNFGLPYWDWAADGQRPTAQQLQSPIWGPGAMGGSGTPVTTGPFGSNPVPRVPGFRVRIATNVNGQLVQTNRDLNRSLGTNAPQLPRRADVTNALALTPYDQPPWNTASQGLRNRLEGWPPLGGLHNRVHVWVGGDMLPSAIGSTTPWRLCWRLPRGYRAASVS